MTKFNNQSEKKSKQGSMDSWLLKLLSRDMKAKTKNKDQPTNNNRNNTKVKNNRKVKEMGNITPTMDHCPRNK